MQTQVSIQHRYTQMNADRTNLNGLTERIIGCAFTVANAMKCGFSEKVYENSLAHELARNGLLVQQQFGITVYYDGVVVGTYNGDLLVEGAVLVELKAVKDIGSRSQRPTPELSGSDRPSALPAAQFRQAASGDQTPGLRTLLRLRGPAPHQSAAPTFEPSSGTTTVRG